MTCHTQDTHFYLAYNADIKWSEAKTCYAIYTRWFKIGKMDDFRCDQTKHKKCTEKLDCIHIHHTALTLSRSVAYSGL